MTAKQKPEANAIPTGTALLLVVRAGFVAQGTTLTSWCQEQGVARNWARQVLLGLRDGPAARRLRAQIIDAARVKKAA